MQILLIDDSRVTRYALRIELKKLGVDVYTADSAETALETLKSRIPDAILMDHIMPGLNGLEAVEIIRADPRTAHVPIVLCTTSQDTDDFAATAKKKGVLTTLPKSLAAQRLPEVIELVHAAIDRNTADHSRTAPWAAEPVPPAPAPALEDPPREAALIALIDERLEAGINKRLTGLVEALRRDLTEMLIAEARHLVESRLADERAASQPAATLQDLRNLETRLRDEVLPNLIEHRVAASLDKQRPEMIADLMRALPAGLAELRETGVAGVSPERGGSASDRVQGNAKARSAEIDVAEAAIRLRDMATTALQSLRAAIKRHER
jgi:CheY-like chemotaxis protein